MGNCCSQEHGADKNNQIDINRPQMPGQLSEGQTAEETHQRHGQQSYVSNVHKINDDQAHVIG
jgi:hypothetical protein